MDKLQVKDVQIGQRVSAVFLLVKKQTQTGKNGKPFLRIALQDKTGTLDARVWTDAEAIAAAAEVNELVVVEGPVGEFQGKPQLTVETLHKPSAEVVGTLDPNDFVLVAPEREKAGPSAAANADANVAQLRSELAKVHDAHVRALLLSLIDEPHIAEGLRRAPAAKEIHHAYVGGLVEHILSCVRLAHRFADQYPMVDRDLLIAGAFLHDLGKVAELEVDKGNIAYTDEGRLVGHLVITAQWIHDRAKSLPGFPPELEHHLTHLVLAHHGRLEFGSPRLPMTLEALLVHHLDEIDSRVNAWLSQMARSSGERWAEPQKPYESLLFKGAIPTDGGKRRGPAFRTFRGGKGAGKRRREVRPEAPHGHDEPKHAEAVAKPPRAERPPRPERADRPPRVEKEPAEKLSFKPFSAIAAPPEAPPPAEPQSSDAD